MAANARHVFHQTEREHALELSRDVAQLETGMLVRSGATGVAQATQRAWAGLRRTTQGQEGKKPPRHVIEALLCLTVARGAETSAEASTVPRNLCRDEPPLPRPTLAQRMLQ